MRKQVFVAAVMAAGVAAPALAQDGPEVYGGVLLGYDKVKIEQAGSQDGVVYGGVLGVQTNLSDAALVGVEGEVTGASTRETAQNVFTAGDDLRVKAGRDLFVGARLGFRPSPALLLYGKAGYTNARTTTTYLAPAASFKVSQNLDGYRVGAGAEVGQGRLRFRGEYRYSDYGEYRINGLSSDLGTKRHQLVLGAIYAF